MPIFAVAAAAETRCLNAILPSATTSTSQVTVRYACFFFLNALSLGNLNWSNKCFILCILLSLAQVGAD